MDKLKERIEQLFHPNQCYVYCETREEVDEFMDMAEYIGIRWINGDKPRDCVYSNKDTNIFINTGYRLRCSFPPRQCDIKRALPMSVFHNYVIAVRNRRK